MMSAKSINTIFCRHYGAKRVLARELGVSFPTITKVLQGEDASARILRCAEKHALAYLAMERQERRQRKEAQSAEEPHPSIPDQKMA